MKSGLIIFLLVFLGFALLQIPVFYRLFSDTQAELVMWVSDARKYRENKGLIELREETEKVFQGLNEQQLVYLEKVTNSTEKLKEFYQLYCIGDDKNPLIHGAELHYFCEKTARSGLLNP